MSSDKQCSDGSDQMKRVLYILAAICALICTSCIKNEFKISFELAPSSNRTYTVLYYASDSRKGWLVDNAVPINSGKGELLGITRNPTLIWIFDRQSYPAAIIYAERGDNLKVEGKESDPASWSVSGNKISERLSGWQSDNQKILTSRDWKAINEAVAKYITSHPDDPTAAILLYAWYDRRQDERGYQKLRKKLTGDADKGKWSDLVARADMLEQQLGSFPKSILLNTQANGADTIVAGRVPTILYFSRSTVKSYKSDIDEIRKLTRQYRDSSRRVIADISFEPDSGARYWSARRDSIDGAVRAWMPLGLSDSLAVSMDVRRIPWWIVLDKKGHTAYRGSDAEKAAATFRKQFPDQKKSQ